MAVHRVDLLPKQAEYLEYEGKVAAIRGGVGSGKTLVNSYWMLREMQRYPRASFRAIGASFQQLKDGFFETFVGRLEKHKIPYRYVETPTPKVTLLRNGAEIKSLSAEVRERLRSLEVDRLLLEEPQTWDAGQETFETLIERLRPSPMGQQFYPGLQPQIRMSFNPPPMGHWLHSLIEQKWSGVYPCWRFGLRENTILQKIDPSYLPMLLETLDPERWPHEIDGEWATVASGVYKGFDAQEFTKTEERLPPLAVDMSMPLLWGFDFNIHKQCSVIAQQHVQTQISKGFEFHDYAAPTERYGVEVEGWQRRIVYVLGEIVYRNGGVQDVLEVFLRDWGDIAKRTGVILYGDASGSNKVQMISSRDAAKSNWEHIMLGLTRAGIRWEARIPNGNPSVQDRVNAVKAQFRTYAGRGFAYDAKCQEVAADLTGTQWKFGKNEIDEGKDKERSHMSDALGYLIYTEQEIERGNPPEFRSFLHLA